MSRSKTIAFFTFIGPAVAAVPMLVTILVLAAFHRDARRIGIAGAALFMAYVYGLIPSAVSGLLLSWIVGRHPYVVHRAASVARVGAVAGFLSSLPLAAWAFLVTETVLAYDRALIAAAFLVLGIISGAVCAILWRRREGAGAHLRKASEQADRSGSILLGFLAALMSSLPGVLIASADAEPAKPNLLSLIADDLATRLGAYGDAAAVTPNLDRLAAEGVAFARAYCQGAVCTPSRASFMLRLNTRHANSERFRRHPDAMTMGRLFREHGYETFSVGKIDHTEEYLDPQAWEIRARDAEVKPLVPQGRRISLEEDLWPDDSVVSSEGRSKIIG